MTTRTISDIAADRVKTLRKERGWSAQQLAAECAKVGDDSLTPAALANIETGRRDPQSGRRRRQVTADEIIVISLALDVSPGSLLMPVTSTAKDRVQIGDRTTTAANAWAWLEGRGSPPRAKSSRGADQAERDERYYVSRPAWLRKVEQHPAYRSAARLVTYIDRALTGFDTNYSIGQIEFAQQSLPSLQAELQQLAEEVSEHGQR